MTLTEAPPQNILALGQANEIRVAQAALKRELRAMDRTKALLTIANFLLDPPEYVGRMRLSGLLRAPYKMGPSLAAKLIQEARLPAHVYERKIGGVVTDHCRYAPNRCLTAENRMHLALAIQARYG